MSARLVRVTFLRSCASTTAGKFFHWQDESLAAFLHFCSTDSSLWRSKFSQTTTQHHSTDSLRFDSTANVFYFKDVHACLFNGNAWSGQRVCFLQSVRSQLFSKLFPTFRCTLLPTLYSNLSQSAATTLGDPSSNVQWAWTQSSSG